jgi:Ras-related protein Rab-1A
MDNNENVEQKEEEEEDEENIEMERLNDFQMNHNYIFRLCLLGDPNAGKTSLLTRFCDNIFKESYNNTIGVDFKVVTLKYKNKIIKVHIWDTAGQERFKSIAVNYFRSAHGFIFIYDITDEDSFKNIENWIDLAFKNTNSAVINFLVGNKNDREEDRKVDKATAEEFAKEKKLIFFEASAKTSDNVEKLFQYCTYKLIQYFDKNKDKYLSENNNNKLSNNAQDIKTDNKEESQCSC